MSELKEACGVIGIFNNDDLNIAKELYYGIFALHHRGQESCGMAVCRDGIVKDHKGMGIVNEIFTDADLAKLQGQIGIGHCRYAPMADCDIRSAEPMTMQFVKGTLSIAHNGNIVNADELREKLMEEQGAIFHTNTDSETLAYLIAKKESETHLLEVAIRQATDMVSGAYAFLVMSPKKLVGIRDPHGLKPLCIGKKGNSYILASESCAIESIGGEFIRDVEPGEIIVVDKNGYTSHKKDCVPEKNHPCIFEYIYFARPDSVIDGQSIYESRFLAGKVLAERYPVEADVVMPVPDSGIDAAIGYAEGSGIPYGIGFIKNRYIGRTFIKPDQAQREEATRIKLNVLKHTVEGKRVVLVDDSMVRGTVSRSLIKMLKKAGAKEVHMRITAPPFVWPCFFGVDIGAKKELAAVRNTIEEIRQNLNADTLGFFKVEDLPRIIPNCKLNGYCDACFTGDYPVPVHLKEEDM